MQDIFTTYPNLKKVSIKIEENVVILSGNVSTYFLKQIAQENVLRFIKKNAPQMTVKNEISVSSNVFALQS